MDKYFISVAIRSKVVPEDFESESASKRFVLPAIFDSYADDLKEAKNKAEELLEFLEKEFHLEADIFIYRQIPTVISSEF